MISGPMTRSIEDVPCCIELHTLAWRAQSGHNHTCGSDSVFGYNTMRACSVGGANSSNESIVHGPILTEIANCVHIGNGAITLNCDLIIGQTPQCVHKYVVDHCHLLRV